jgi:hypothetical protein
MSLGLCGARKNEENGDGRSRKRLSANRSSCSACSGRRRSSRKSAARYLTIAAELTSRRSKMRRVTPLQKVQTDALIRSDHCPGTSSVRLLNLLPKEGPLATLTRVRPNPAEVDNQQAPKFGRLKEATRIQYDASACRHFAAWTAFEDSI